MGLYTSDPVIVEGNQFLGGEPASRPLLAWVEEYGLSGKWHEAIEAKPASSENPRVLEQPEQIRIQDRTHLVVVPVGYFLYRTAAGNFRVMAPASFLEKYRVVNN